VARAGSLYADNPLDRVGWLKGQMFRAGRCIVHTGKHTMGWSKKKAVATLGISPATRWAPPNGPSQGQRWVDFGRRAIHTVRVSIALESPDLSADDLPEPGAYAAFHPFIRGVFSQWHPTVFVIDELRFVTAEQWMMFAKAKLFNDDERAAAILRAEDPAEQKRLGQQIKAFDQERWDRWKITIVYRGNRAKFQQNEGASRQLRSTAPAMLVEANPRDWIWGVGWSFDDPRASDPNEWRGQNLLGRVLTKVRQDLG
jgi:ribA/ribD-fused uncharacterized protein